PRFVRRGDKPTISVNVSNTSDKVVKGKARIEFVDPETDKIILATTKDIELKANESKPVSFSFMPKNYPDVVIVRMTVDGNNFSDGEQHYLPVLPDKEMVTTTQAFSLQNKGQYTVDLTKLFPEDGKQNRLTYEYTSHPEWMLIEALPTVSNPSSDNAISLVTALYANSLSEYLLKSNPSIKKFIDNEDIKQVNEGKSPLQTNEELKSLVLDETPWVADAKNETEQRELLKNFFDENATQYRKDDILHKLMKLQNSDGSFSWWPGMRGSRYVTNAVYMTLVRLKKMTGAYYYELNLTANQCRDYLSSELKKEAAEMKKIEKEGFEVLPSETALETIYSLSLAKENHKHDVKPTIEYMVGKLSKVPTVYTIYGKANAAVIFALNGQKTKAKEFLQSINEYSVYKPEMGRYYDSRKALYSWRDYKIPTQVAVIETYKLLQPDSILLISDLQQWLLQSKRTQGWDTPLNTVDAVYAFLGGNNARSLSSNDNDFAIRINNKNVDVVNNAIGYVKGVETGENLKTITFEKNNKGTSWGAVYAQSIQTIADVAEAGTNLKVKREVITNKEVKVGDRIKVRLTITADRDYDFVQLQDKRAACLEPVKQLSGYSRGYYIAPKDNVTNYYFDVLSKGEHVIETEYYVDREGEYTSGLCTVQCAYAPEYSGRDAAFKINVK
ncbi:MAG: alpha-2-macroglobulin, partial [Prevotella sp.]|nr:alpha-2-macroglobulin [Prevotella sp.]